MGSFKKMSHPIHGMGWDGMGWDCPIPFGALVHSIIHNQLSAPPFENLIKNGFIQARITNETIGQIEKPKDICFKFYDLYCSSQDCDERTLLKCAWCKNTLCYYHLIEDLHLHL